MHHCLVYSAHVIEMRHGNDTISRHLYTSVRSSQVSCVLSIAVARSVLHWRHCDKYVVYIFCSVDGVCAVWYVRENHDIGVSCMPTYSEKYLEARYLWRDHLGRGAARSDFVLHGNGTMFIESAQLTDSDTYRCHVDLPDHHTEDYTHSIIGKSSFSSFIFFLSF